jgi:hypothetical protein
MTDMTQGTCHVKNMKDAHVHPDVRITVLSYGRATTVKTTQDASAGKDGREAP